MELFMPLLVIFFVIAILVLSIAAIVKAFGAEREVEELRQRVRTLENELHRRHHAPPPAMPAWIAEPISAPPPPTLLPPTLPSALPPPLPPHQEKEPAPPLSVAPPVNWEQFMGAKLFAWIGGLALFIGVAFFVKYAFERNLVSPEVRMALAFFTGLGLLVAGARMKRKATAATAQSLCSAGLLILYATTFACHDIYRFAFFGQVQTFLLMALITAAAFFLSVKMNALAVSVLGIAGGFLTPVLLSSGQDAPLALFGYIALLDAGLLAVALRKRWNSLPVLGAVGTVLMQAGWVARFFVAEKYSSGDKILVPMAVFAGFEALFLAGAFFEKRLKETKRAISGSAVALGAVALMAAFYFLCFQSVAQRPAVLFGYVFLVDFGLLAVVLIDGALVFAETAAGAFVFFLLATWTQQWLAPAHLRAALAIYFVFALLHPFTLNAVRRLRAAVQPWWRYLPQTTLPFLLLIMAVGRLPMANPSPVFGLALLLVVLLLVVSKKLALDALPAVALGSVVALEHTWHLHRFDPAQAGTPVAWYLVFYFVFTVFPFLFRRSFEKKTVPWAVAALAGPLHFYLLHDVVRAAWPAMIGAMGLLPAAFSVPALIGVAVLRKKTPADSPARTGQLAWFGGVALFFITLIFPLQFEHEWVTIGWALEGAALCWLLRRVPHRGLGIAGVALLAVAFVRLALNPAVLDYHARAAWPVFNWYLYAYGIVAGCFFVAAKMLAPPRNIVLGRNAPPPLCALGTVLLFLLVNIEIADFFAAPGTESLAFQFVGNFARDMTYSIAWALFALLLLVVGIRKKLAPPRYASIALLVVTLLKLFIHDLSQLGQLYRIAAFITVAAIAMVASFLYQRFFGGAEKKETPPVPPPLP
jgi:uncharacterized membrane protein